MLYLCKSGQRLWHCQQRRSIENHVKVLRKFGTILQQFHIMLARLNHNSVMSRPLSLSNGVKHGCVLAPTLFSIMFSVILMDTFRDTDVGIGINYRTDSSVFNLRRLQAKSKVRPDTVHDFLFADDWALNTVQKLTCNTVLISSPRFATALDQQSI